ncbi:hypothetical protein GYW75_07375 [Gilliamella sp. ESL0232]|uniref:STY0301 family protein n=1 Tax=unclassified Gilliamella TaxID=2685620 RepID=UPI0015806718|nr:MULTISPECIES: STY0301 family protein [unclassified Gilliamella]MCO6549880.1 hypothetical protein [Gilliamella sp.]NUE96203.1 hypothetical protein [Gilliamella sp. ESL0232]
MKNKILNLATIAIIGASFCDSVNANEEIVCPESVTIKYSKPDLEVVPDGWEVSEEGYDIKKIDSLILPEDIAHSTSLRRLNQVEVYSGKSADSAKQIKPKPATINGKKYKAVWLLDGSNDTNKLSFWASCNYSYNNKVQLIKPIDASLKTCWAIYTQDQQQGTLAKLVCSAEKVK